jgi:hypothetical protein
VAEESRRAMHLHNWRTEVGLLAGEEEQTEEMQRQAAGAMGLSSAHITWGERLGGDRSGRRLERRASVGFQVME